MKLPYWLAVATAMTLPLSAVRAQEAGTEAPAAPATEAGEKEAKAPTDRELAGELMNLFRTGKVDEAESRYQEALQAHPNSPALANLRYTAALVLMRAERPAEALVHMEAFAERNMRLAAHSGSSDMFYQTLGMLISATEQHAESPNVEKILDSFSEKAQQLDNPSPAVMAAIATHRAARVAKQGDAEQARSLVEPYYTQTKSTVEENPDDARAIRSFVSVLKHRVAVEEAIEGGNPKGAQGELSTYLARAAEARPQAAGSIYISESMGQLSVLARTAPEEAEQLLNELKEYRDGAGSEVKVTAQMDQHLAQIERMIEQTKKMNAMLGQDAPYSADVFDGWVNGTALSAEDLKGKVVLLDFFAVWCGPCIMTFPHLRDWHDEYADDGLVIIGITRYHQYGWDDEASRPKREAGITPENERSAMEKFVAFHELRHPVAFDPEAETMQEYMVSGIPHVALIDRAGKLKMFRIGAGDKNAQDIEEAIKEALAASADE